MPCGRKLGSFTACVLFAACEFEPGALPARSDAASGPGAEAGAGPSDAMLDVPVMPDATTRILIEAEAPSFFVSADLVHLWVFENALAGYSGSGYVRALPNDGNGCNSIDSIFCGAYNSYNFTVHVAGTYRVTIRHASPSGSSDSVFWSIDDSIKVTEDLDPDVTTSWIDDATTRTVTLTAGSHTFAMRMRETGVRIDSIRLERE
jgi:hypothetical protein